MTSEEQDSIENLMEKYGYGTNKAGKKKAREGAEDNEKDKQADKQ